MVLVLPWRPFWGEGIPFQEILLTLLILGNLKRLKDRTQLGKEYHPKKDLLCKGREKEIDQEWGMERAGREQLLVMSQ